MILQFKKIKDKKKGFRHVFLSVAVKFFNDPSSAVSSQCLITKLGTN